MFGDKGRETKFNGIYMCKNCENWFFGMFGLLMAVLPFLGLGPQLHKWIMVLGGLLVAILAFAKPKKAPVQQ